MSSLMVLIIVIPIIFIILSEKVVIRVRLFGGLKIEINFIFFGIILSKTEESKTKRNTKRKRLKFIMSAVRALYRKCDLDLTKHKDYTFSASIYLYDILLFMIQYAYRNLKRNFSRRIKG